MSTGIGSTIKNDWNQCADPNQRKGDEIKIHYNNILSKRGYGDVCYDSLKSGGRPEHLERCVREAFHNDQQSD